MKIRAAMHVHSEWSYHASWSLRSIARAFANRGYDVIFMSEHERGFDQSRWFSYQRACEDASTDRIRLVPGIEYEDRTNVVHVTVWGDNVPFLGQARPTLDLLTAACHAGAVAVLAHPWRRDAVSRYRPEWARLLTGVEVWNRQYDGVAPNDRALRFALREGLAQFASLDFHTRRQFFPLSMSAEIEGDGRTTDLMDALRGRRFRPELLGISTLALAGGVPAAILRTAEAARRIARLPLRAVTDLVNS